MYYKEFLRVRHTLFYFCVVLAIMGLLSAIIHLAGGDHVNVTVGDDVPKALTAHKIEDVPWIGLFAGAAFFAAVVSTILGSTLSQENEHLALALTKPVSRIRYASTVMAVDAAGIFISGLIAFAFIVGLITLFGHGSVRLVNTSDDAMNVVRYILFPLAWYGLILAFSASLRNRAGIVQGMIWPVAFVLSLLALAPLPGLWHQVIVWANFINPLTYTNYVDHGSGLQVSGGSAGVISVTAATGAAALTVMIAASYAAAALQWRRVEA